jgi:glycosyltransferase involved in cell wall biosynthesis
VSKIGYPNILILNPQVPFTSGGAELLVEGLRREFAARDYCVDVVSLPFNAQPKKALLNQIAMWRALELKAFAGRKVDLVIAAKFPSYMVSHPNKVVWLIHQHRQLYELYGSRFGDFDTGPMDESLRRMILQADRQSLGECKARYTISENVSARLKRYLDFDSEVLCPPLPLGEAYFSEQPEDYVLSVGRLCSIKRVDLVIKAMPEIDDKLKLKIVGLPDEPAIDTYLRSEIDKHHLWHRVEFLGRVDDQMLLDLFARAFAVYYAPYDEDYGFVTLEALASGRPVITALDSGSVLEFVQDEVNGLIVEPNEKAIAGAFNRLLSDQQLYARLAENASSEKKNTNTWDDIIKKLTESVC